MVTLDHITIDELQSLLQKTHLPGESRLTVTFEDEHADIQLLIREKTIAALKSLRGSGNGNLMRTLLEDRAQDKDT